MFGRKSRAELEQELYKTQLELAQMNREKQSALKRLSDYLRGDRGECVSGKHCHKCDHSIRIPSLCGQDEFLCDLDIPCKAFARLHKKD